MSKFNGIVGKILIVTMVVFLIFSYSTEVYAKTNSNKGKYFKDINSRTQYYKEINYLYKHGAYSDIAKKGARFKPGTMITKKEFNKTLKNLYGVRIQLGKAPSGKLTQKYATETLTSVSEQLGYKVTWNGGSPKAKVTRAKASHYIYQMIALCKDGTLNP